MYNWDRTTLLPMHMEGDRVDINVLTIECDFAVIAGPHVTQFLTSRVLSMPKILDPSTEWTFVRVQVVWSGYDS
jgi:hypothetical protein